MKYYYLFTLISLLFSCKEDNKIFIFKQWHLSPRVDTTNIKQSIQLPQAKGQTAIYLEIEELIKEKKLTLVAEGCEGDPQKEFQKKFNGWSIDSLKSIVNETYYKDVQAPVAMKILAKYPKRAEVICGDNAELIKKHNLSYSDIKGLYRFYQKFKELPTDDPFYRKYLDSLQGIYNRKITHPLVFLKKELLLKIGEFEKLLIERNNYFLKQLRQKERTLVLIIGALHVQDIVNRLALPKEQVLVKELSHSDISEEGLINKLRESIKGEKNYLVNQVPESFQIQSFPLKNLLLVKDLMKTDEEKELRSIMSELKLDFKILLSDYDGDGIRDFTLSRSKDKVIITAEDRDWDNDGISNLRDHHLGPGEKEEQENSLSNRFKINYSKENFSQDLKKYNLKSLDFDGQSQEAIVLKVLFEILAKFKHLEFDLDYVVAKERKFSFGKEVYFSYIPQSRSIEYYPKELFSFITEKKKRAYPSSELGAFVNGYLLPLLVHSISHELIHSLKSLKVYTLAHANNWSFIKKRLNTKYLVGAREKDLAKLYDYQDYQFRGKSYTEWLKEHQKYIKTVNKLLKRKKNFGEMAKTTPWYTGTKSTRDELQLSFLGHHKISSLYSLSQPAEWLAESLSMCIYRSFYPVKSVDDSTKAELSLGINPAAPTAELCALLKL